MKRKINLVCHLTLSVRNRIYILFFPHNKNQLVICFVMNADYRYPICNNVKQIYAQIDTHMTVLSSTKMSQL